MNRVLLIRILDLLIPLGVLVVVLLVVRPAAPTSFGDWLVIVGIIIAAIVIHGLARRILAQRFASWDEIARPDR